MRLYVLWCIVLTLGSHLAACPTCIGMPKKGERPYFERNGIQYILNPSIQPIPSPSLESYNGPVFDGKSEQEANTAIKQ